MMRGLYVITEVDRTVGSIRISMDDNSRLHFQKALYVAIRCAWHSVAELWVETKHAAVDVRPFPEWKISVKTISQNSIYLSGLTAEICEMLEDLGLEALAARGCLNSMNGHGLSMGVPEKWLRSEMEDLIAHIKDNSAPYPWR